MYTDAMRDEIQKQFEAIIQSRSNYQLEKFVLGQHHSPEMQYHQLLMEMSGLIQNEEDTLLEIEKLEAEIEELLETGKKSDAVEAKIKQKAIRNKRLNLEQGERELKHLATIYDRLPKFTREEIEQAQKDYWETKLTRVAQLQFLQAQTGVNWAQLDALQQANIIEEAITEIPSMSKIKNNLTQLTIDKREQNG